MVAARERFPGRALTDADGDLFLVEMDSLPPALHLTHQVVLDGLGVDDRVSTGRIAPAARADPDPLLETCGALADAAYDWWDGAPPPLVYRSRVVPGSGRNVAFTRPALGRVASVRRLREARALHTALVLQSGFTVPPAWLA